MGAVKSHARAERGSVWDFGAIYFSDDQPTNQRQRRFPIQRFRRRKSSSSVAHSTPPENLLSGLLIRRFVISFSRQLPDSSVLFSPFFWGYRLLFCPIRRYSRLFESLRASWMIVWLISDLILVIAGESICLLARF